MIKFVLVFAVFFSQLICAEEVLNKKIYDIDGSKYEYQMPSALNFATTMPHNYWSFLKNSFSFSDDNLKAWGAIILSSAIIINYDQKITNNVQKFGRSVGIGNAENTVGTLKIGGFKLLRRPSDVGSAMYFIGDGWVTLGFTAGFLTTGLITKDERTLTVANQLFQGLLLTGVTTQIIKRTTGRESPIVSSRPGGRWKPLPSFHDYSEKTSRYDAFPSGHLATTMTTFMILSENYPEYHWIKPVGYTLMTLLSFQMVNNSVHWAGDYPLALGIGYMLGKTIVENGRKKLNENSDKSEVSFVPFISPTGQVGMSASLNF